MSSFYDLASLVMIPSGKKAGKVYSQKPLSTDGQLDFTRASTATRIGSDGLIEKTRTNLLTYSNDTSNSDWTRVGAAPTSGQTGYDGSSDAWLLSATGGGAHYALQTKTDTGVSTFSVYAKQGASKGIRIAINGGGDHWANFNLELGTQIGTAASVLDTEIINFGSGWYRISVTANKTGSGWGVIYILNSSFSPSYTASGETIYIQDAQLEQGLVATSYIETTTAAVSVGSVDNMPRLNYTPGSATSCPSLLLEPQRTNLIPHSEYFGAWSTFGTLTLTNNYAESIEGVSNAARFQTGNSARGVIYYGLSVSSSVTYTISVFVKSVSGTNKIRIGADNGCSIPQGAETFDVTSSWTRIEKTLTSTQSNWNVFFDNVASGDACTGTYLDTDILIYGFQVEAGSYASSYIPSYGATVSRVAENCNKTGVSGLIGQTEGTLFAEYDQNLIGQSATRRIMAFSDGTTSNRIVVYVSSSNGIDFYVRNSGGDLFLGSAASPIGNTKGVHKIAAAYKNNDYAVYLDGTLIISGSGTNGTIPSCTRIDLGSQLGANDLFEPISEALVFKTRLSNTQLADLTSIDS